MMKKLVKYLKKEKASGSKSMDAIQHNNLLCKFYSNQDSNGCKFVRMSFHRIARIGGERRLVNSYDVYDILDLPALAAKIANWHAHERSTPRELTKRLTTVSLIDGLLEDLQRHCGDQTAQVLTELVVLADQFRSPSGLVLLLNSFNQQKREARLQSLGSPRPGGSAPGSVSPVRNDRKVS